MLFLMLCEPLRAAEPVPSILKFAALSCWLQQVNGIRESEEPVFEASSSYSHTLAGYSSRDVVAHPIEVGGAGFHDLEPWSPQVLVLCGSEALCVFVGFRLGLQ